MAAELSEKYVEEMKREMERELMKLDKKFQEFKARQEEREKKMKEIGEERERMISRFWLERAIYIAIIIGSATIIVTMVW